MSRLKRDREEFGLEVTDFTGGKPTIHPDIIEIVQYGYDIGNRICLITHGQWNNLEKIDRIIFAEPFLPGIQPFHLRRSEYTVF